MTSRLCRTWHRARDAGRRRHRCIRGQRIVRSFPRLHLVRQVSAHVGILDVTNGDAEREIAVKVFAVVDAARRSVR